MAEKITDTIIITRSRCPQKGEEKRAAILTIDYSSGPCHRMGMAIQRVSQKDVAERAGVHVTTVSLALRNSPRLPKETRERVRQLAQEMGYEPDPMLSALTVYRKRVQMPHYQGVLAWLDNTKHKDATPASRIYSGYWEGALERCKELGFKLEEFLTSDTPLSRLAGVLRARNISNILLPPQPRHLSHINFDWANFSSVSFGFSLTRPRLHLVTSAQFRAARLAVRTMRSYGYRRIGFTTLHNAELRTDLNFSSGYLAEQRLGRREELPIFEFDDEQSTTRRHFLRDFKKWFRAFKPDGIISLDREVYSALGGMGIGPETCGYASLDLPQDNQGIAGVHQNGRTIGRTAVDFLVDMSHRNERGIPQTPLRILVEGIWRDGPSLPRRNSNV